MRKLKVNLGSRHYTIEIAPGLIDQVGRETRTAVGAKTRNAVIISNPTVDLIYGSHVDISLRKAGFRTQRTLVPDGEKYKNLRTANLLYTFLIDHHIERGDVIIALGGGVIGDLAGFVAATYLRGIRVVQVPTTLLAQIDSSIGGKTGVNHQLGKNLIGAFHQPSLVLIDPHVLSTLPPRELRSGLFEAIKYGIIRDKNLFDLIRDHSRAFLAGGLSGDNLDPMTQMIYSCCAIKADVVEADEQESGLRRILNFGHTVGHALETVTNYRRFLHGEAVGYGMRAASRIAELLGSFDSESRSAVDEAITALGLLPPTKNLALHDIIVAMQRDKKVEAGNLAFVLPVAIGQVVLRSDVPPLTVRKALRDTLG